MRKSKAALQQAIENGSLGAQAATDLRNNKFWAKDAQYFIRAAIGTLGGSLEILEPSVKREKGITNFNNAELPSGKSLAVDAIRVASMANASVVGDEYANLFADAAVYNGEIRVSQDGKVVYEGPISAFHSADSSREVLELENPFVLYAGKPVTVEVTTAAAAQANTNMEVVFYGSENATR